MENYTMAWHISLPKPGEIVKKRHKTGKPRYY
jgi:hypothetical protein